MERRVYKKNPFGVITSGIKPIIFTAAIVIIILIGLRQTEEAHRAEGLRALEEAIMRVSIHSYAVNGYFPESLDYISENFGIYIDRSRFVVHYEVFGANLVPHVRVFELGR